MQQPEEGLNVFALTLPVHQDIEFTFAGKPQVKKLISETNLEP
jgi:hypothetical protein